MKTLARLGLLALAVGISAIVTSATPIGPVYPPPGGVTFTASGLPGDSGGRTNYYSDLDPSAYTDLYWGLWAPDAVKAGLDGQLHTLTFAGGTSTMANFYGTTPWIDADPYRGAPGVGYTMYLPVLFQIRLTGATFVPAASVGLNGGLGLVADIDGTSFSANLQFLTDYGYGWQPLNSLPQFPGNRTVSEFSGGFYHTPPPPEVPDTAGTLALLVLAGVALGGLRRRV